MNFKPLLNPSRLVASFAVLFIFLCIYVALRSACHDSLHQLPQHLQKYTLHKDITNVNYSADIEKLKLQLEKINSKQNINNINKFRPVEDDTPILVIQVHKNVKRLQYLIISLAQVRGIQIAFLIFSHSFYYESINSLIRSIEFCKVMQIFYPFSIQLHPHRYPGIDPGDCKPALRKDKRTTYCLIRDAELTEHKQHWWWKANFVFQRMKWSHKHKMPVIFLEEENYVSPDLLHMFQYVHRSLEYFPHIEIMSFGRPWTGNVDTDLLTVEPWRPPFDVGLAFNRTTWKKILKLSPHFCMYNDYSWSYSLFHLFENFPRHHVDMVGFISPRVLSTKEFINTDDIFEKYSELFNTVNLFPNKVKAVSLFGPEGRVERVSKGPPIGSGGWNDIRDQLLCLDPLMSTTTEEKRYDDPDVTRS